MMRSEEQPRAESPFGGISMVVPPASVSKNRRSKIWAGVFIFALLLLSTGGYFAVKEFGDPMRTLPVFPTDKYFSNPDSLEGASFQADLRVDADLGWQMGVGRLMAFSTMNEGGQNHLAVLIPAKIADSLFDKNQRYRVELEVGEGGLIRAKSFKKL